MRLVCQRPKQHNNVHVNLSYSMQSDSMNAGCSVQQVSPLAAISFFAVAI